MCFQTGRRTQGADEKDEKGVRVEHCEVTGQRFGDTTDVLNKRQGHHCTYHALIISTI